MTFTKRGRERELAWEATGLRWLASAGTVRVAEVLAVGDARLELETVGGARATPAAAEQFGRDLAALHASARDRRFGQAPDAWDGDGYLGPSDDLLALPLHPTGSWGVAYAAQLRSVGAVAAERRRLPAELGRLLERVCERLEAGDLDDGAAPARVHGDLWSGNVLWGADGAVLIDPAAHVGHPQLDLALLELFGLPHLERVLGAYAEVASLPDGWRERTSLHQALHLLLHVACFGGGYVEQCRAALERWV